jgi:hypothetical protein
MLVQAISPLLRSDFAQSTAGQTPNGDLHGQFRPSDERAALNEPDRPVTAGRAQKGVFMIISRATGPPASPQQLCAPPVRLRHKER